jgi:antitoxin HigA-1
MTSTWMVCGSKSARWRSGCLGGNGEGMIPMNTNLRSIHPGEVLSEEFLKPLKLSQDRLAFEIGIDARRINEIVLGKRKISAEAALRLARYFGSSPQFWLGLQTEYDLDVAADRLGDRLEREVKPRDIDNALQNQ